MMKACLDVALCYFFGILGVHKFREKKILMGLLYLFTGGLFFGGWLYDCVKYVLIAIDAWHTKKSATPPQVDENGLSDNSHKTLSIVKAVMKGIATVFCIIFSLASLPRFTALFGVLAALLLLPIAPWQTWLSRFLKSDIKALIAVLLVVIMVINSPSASTSPSSTTPNTSNKGGVSITTTTSAPTTSTATITTTKRPTTTITTTKATTVVTTRTTVPTPSPTPAPTPAPTSAPTAPPHIHNFSDATCMAPKTCVSCGITEGSVSDHYYNEGICVVCGNADPHYTPSVMVWIPTNGGTKYHSKSSCSKMIDPLYVTIEEAEAQGFTACGRCY